MVNEDNISPKAPRGIKIISIFGGMAAILALIVLIPASAITVTVNLFALESLYILLMTLVVIGLLYGFLRLHTMKKIGWKIVMVLQGIRVISFIPSLITGEIIENILGLVVGLVIIGYLWMNKDLFI